MTLSNFIRLSLTIAIFIIIWCTSAWAAENAVSASADKNSTITCDTDAYINWPEYVKIGNPYEYTLIGSGSSQPAIANFTLQKSNTTIETSKNVEKYLRYFREAWESEIIAEATVNDCNLSASKKVTSFSLYVASIAHENDIISNDLSELLEKKGIRIKHIIKNEDGKWISPTDHEFIKDADIILLHDKNILTSLWELVEVHKNQPVDFSTKRLVIASDLSESFLSKIIAGSISRLGMDTAYIIPTQSVITSLVLLGDSNNPKIFETGEKISYEEVSGWWTLSRLFSVLAYNGLSYNFMSLLLVVIVSTLVINITKQILGLNGYWVHAPIIAALIIHLVWLTESFIIFLAGVVAYILTILITKKIYLLLHARRSLFISLFIIIFLMSVGATQAFFPGWINIETLTQPIWVITLVVVTLIIEKIFQEWSEWKLTTSALYLLQFGFLTGFLYAIFHFEWLKYFLVSFPDTILFLFIGHIIIGRYTGLQLVEYIRFWPILRRTDEEE